MTTAIVHGDPGSFKTSALISDYLVPAVKAGRLVVTNIRGVKTLEQIATIYAFDLPETSQIILVPFNEAGFDSMAKFFHWVPEGAMILMDEGQRVYPTRLKDFKLHDCAFPLDIRRPRTVEDAFDSHRHMNWDIYISSPNINKIHKEIRAVAEFAYRHKNLATVFSFMKGRYKRVTHNAENSGSALSHTISSSIRKIDKRCFDVYESTATGQTKDSTASFNFFKQPKVLLVLCIVVYSLWNLGSTLFTAGGLPVIFGGTSKQPIVQNSEAAVAVSSKTSSSIPARDVHLRPNSKNPFNGLTLYYVGDLPAGMLFEVVYPDKSAITVSQRDLRAMGFLVNRVTASIAKVTINNETIFVFTKPRKISLTQQLKTDET